MDVVESLIPEDVLIKDELRFRERQLHALRPLIINKNLQVTPSLQ